MPHAVVPVRTAAIWIALATIAALHDRHADQALTYLEGLVNLARLHRDEYTLVGQMVRVSLAGLGLNLTWETLQAEELNEEQLKRLQAAWQQVELINAVEKGLIGERIFSEQMFTMLRQTNYQQVMGMVGGSQSASQELLHKFVVMPAYRMTSIDDDELFSLQSMQAAIECSRALTNGQSWQKVVSAADRTLSRLNWSNPIERYRYFFSSATFPNIRRALQHCLRVETQRQLTFLGIALKRYQLRHGRFPEQIDQLVPEFLPAAPWDFMAGQPLRYRLDAQGQPLFYSVGEDSRDDHGDPQPSIPLKNHDLWSGHDAVWPSAESGDLKKD